jgi:polyphosphate kinase 2
MSQDEKYEHKLRKLQVELVKSQAWAMSKGQKALVIFEGRDAAGKDGTILRIAQHLSQRATRVVALPKPTEREHSQWYFQRYIHHLPAAGEWVLFDRSWYNRGGVEPVMGFCTPAEHEQFLMDVPALERMLVESGVILVKYWLDVSRDEQSKRLKQRRKDPLKQLKTGPMDVEAQKRWDSYTQARDTMLTRTDTPLTPWICVRSDDKQQTRLNVIRHLLGVLGPPGQPKASRPPDPKVLFPFDIDALTDGRLER